MRNDAFPETIPALLDSKTRTCSQLPVCRQRTVHGHWTQISWNDFHRQLKQVACGLQQLGLKPGDRLAVIARTNRQWQTVELATLMVGGVVVGIEPHASSEHLQNVLRHSDACCLAVESSEILRRLQKSFLESAKFVVNFDANESTVDGKIVNWSGLTAGGRSIDRHLPPVSPEQAATLIYTSGTTGQPKAIEFSHRQLMVACKAIVRAFPQLTMGDSTLCWLPMAHLFQRMMNLVAMTRGVTIHFVEDPRDIVTCAQEVQPAVFVGVPRFYEKLYEGIQAELAQLHGFRKWLTDEALETARAFIDRTERDEPFSLMLHLKHRLLNRFVLRKIRRVMGGNMKFMITGSAPIATQLLEFFHALGWPLLNAYGISENTVPMAANQPHDFRLGSVGKPLPENQLRLARDGEILVKGPGVFGGYWKDASDDTCFTADGYYRTGDVGSVDEDGYLYLSGRKSDIIKLSTGRRICPVKVESAIERSPLIDRLVVVGNSQKHLVGLVTVHRDQLQELSEGFELDENITDEQFARHPIVNQLVRHEMQTWGRELERYERVEYFAILPRPFSIDRGELTATLKLRRKQIESNYAEIIEQLYRGVSAPIVRQQAVHCEGVPVL